MCLPPQDGWYCEQLAKTRHDQAPNKQRCAENHQERINVTQQRCLSFVTVLTTHVDHYLVLLVSAVCVSVHF